MRQITPKHFRDAANTRRLRIADAVKITKSGLGAPTIASLDAFAPLPPSPARSGQNLPGPIRKVLPGGSARIRAEIHNLLFFMN
jgi:hypothetical protein